jgi:hypothetical protein
MDAGKSDLERKFTMPVLLGQGEQVQMNMFINLYLNLVPVVASRKLEAGYEGCADPQGIADEAFSIAQMALDRIGISVQNNRK